MAKTKVAPVKSISILPFDLCGASKAARLTKRLKIYLHISNAPTFAYTDSQINLDQDPRIRDHKVSKIQTHYHPQDWNYVRFFENSSVLATWGINLLELQNSNLRWNDPDFLLSSKCSGLIVSEKVMFLTFKTELSNRKDLLFRYSNLYS